MVPCYFCGAEECDCIERIECKEAGTDGHMFCGICAKHGVPRFRCTQLHSEARVMRKVMLREHPTAKEAEYFDNFIRITLLGKRSSQ